MSRRRRTAYSDHPGNSGRTRKAIYSEDEAYGIRKSHENPVVWELYEKFLTDGPCGHISHKLLHTGYTARGKYL
jgi:NADH-quinone oxidoreductase subunit G/[NiFe] hydrogenase diaphorase moiety small subunit